MKETQSYIISALLGLAFAYSSVSLLGIGAAIAIPETILKPLVEVSPILAFSLVDLFTSGLLLSLVFLFIFLAAQAALKKKMNLSVLIYSIPFVLLHGYMFIKFFPESNYAFLILTILPKYLAIAICCYVLYQLNTKNNYDQAG